MYLCGSTDSSTVVRYIRDTRFPCACVDMAFKGPTGDVAPVSVIVSCERCARLQSNA